jgi:hypothetical protein
MSKISECLNITDVDSAKLDELSMELMKEVNQVSDVLLNGAQTIKVHELFSEEPLSDYERKLLLFSYFTGCNVTKMREASKIGIGGTSDLSQLEKMVELMERARKVMGKDS